SRGLELRGLELRGLELRGDTAGADSQGVSRLTDVSVRSERDRYEIIRGDDPRHRGELFGADGDLGRLAGLQVFGGGADLPEDVGVLDERGADVHASGVRRARLVGFHRDAVEAHDGGGEGAVDLAADVFEGF